MSHEVVRNRFERGMPVRLSERGVSFHIRTPKGSPSKINWTERRGRVSRVRKYTKKIIVHWDGNAAPQSDALPAEFFERAD
jgi:hypothetical protein